MFEVVWLQTALDELAALWVPAASALRQSITAATHLIDQELQRDPENQGESRQEGERALFVYPLGVTFEVVPRRRVRVLHVWDIRPLREKGGPRQDN
ncbi:MAG TPA: hypothetical protein VFE78_15310 [Gemmataceae bacterium]|jgi:hypothetical protein|nr:hypothetical protein [Gemmataceae bacterium]